LAFWDDEVQGHIWVRVAWHHNSMSIAGSSILLSNGDCDEVIAWHNKVVKVDSISTPEVVLAALEHVITHVGEDWDGYFITTFDVVHVERIDEWLHHHSFVGGSLPIKSRFRQGTKLSVYRRKDFIILFERRFFKVITDGSDQPILASCWIFAEPEDIMSDPKLLAIKLDKICLRLEASHIVPLSELEGQIVAWQHDVVESNHRVTLALNIWIGVLKRNVKGEGNVVELGNHIEFIATGEQVLLSIDQELWRRVDVVHVAELGKAHHVNISDLESDPVVHLGTLIHAIGTDQLDIDPGVDLKLTSVAATDLEGVPIVHEAILLRDMEDGCVLADKLFHNVVFLIFSKAALENLLFLASTLILENDLIPTGVREALVVILEFALILNTSNLKGSQIAQSSPVSIA
jgi:hypothetical protein